MNPVLQRELVANLRSPRAFVMLGSFLLLVGLLVVGAWPKETEVDLANPTAARQLVELLFAGQFLLASLTAPAFAAGSLTTEKEAKTYELLLASALRPRTIVWGKWSASLVPSLLMVVASLPIVMLCLPLGGISFYEAAAAYLTLIIALACFTLVSLFASSYFARTTAALIASYIVVLPATLIGLALWQASSGGAAERRLVLFFVLLPIAALAASVVLFRKICARLWYPPDVGSEGREVVDEQQELRRAVGLIIQRHRFPDRLFAPAKRTEPLPDGANPILDKELRSELFSQGTLMLRLVVQISLLLAVPLMAACLYFHPSWAPWYLCYVLTFNMLISPALMAGGISGERERGTLDLLLTTTLPWSTIVWGKLLGGLRVSGVLTTFLLWPVVLACTLVPEYYPNLGSFAAMAVVVALTCELTATASLCCSQICPSSSASLTTAYLTLAGIFWLPPAAYHFTRTFFPESILTALLHAATIVSPAAAMFSVPLEFTFVTDEGPLRAQQLADWPIFCGHLVVQGAAILGLLIFLSRPYAAPREIE